MEDGADIAKNLAALYVFMGSEISRANAENVTQPLDDVMGMLREIKSAWDQIPTEYHYLTENN